MSDERDTKVEGAVGETGEVIELDTDPTDELDEAMRDALEAVESGGRGAPDAGDADEPADAAEAEGADSQDDLAARLRLERERSLRALADLENYRKRIQRERREESRYRAFEPMRQFVAVVDNLERALASEGSVDDLKQGVEMILKQMSNLLADHGVRRVEAIGQPFDPSVHEAVSREESPDVTAPTVSEEMQTGYLMHERLLRPAVVKVSMPAAPGDAGDDGKDGA